MSSPAYCCRSGSGCRRTRAYRLQADDGERIIGRGVSSAWAAGVAEMGVAALRADDVYAALTAGRAIIDLAEGLQLRRARVMGADRIELAGFTEAMRDRLRAYGLFSEIISWTLLLRSCRCPWSRRRRQAARNLPGDPHSR